MCYLLPWQFRVVIICLSSTAPKILTYRCFCSNVLYWVVVKQTENHVFMTARIFCLVPWAVSELPSSVVRILVSAWRECPKNSRKIEWWQTVLPWWLSTDLSGVQGLHYHVNHQGVFVMDSVDICGWLWKYVNKIGNLIKT